MNHKSPCNEELIKLTPYQAVFYYEWLQDPKRTDYNLVVDNIVEGEFDIKKNEESIKRLINNTFIFRVNIINKDGELYWKVREPLENVVTFFSRKLSDEKIFSFISEPFDLEKDSLVRHYLIKEDERRFRVIHIYSHIVIDGISTDEYYKKWASYYNGEEVQEIPLIEQIKKHIELSDYFKNIINNNQKEMNAFWLEHLKDIEPLDFSFLMKRYSTEALSQKIINENIFYFGEDILLKIKSLRHKYKITPYIFGQLTFAILLYKLTGQDSIGISYPISILEGKELKYGAHVNTMILDYRFNPDLTLSQLISNVLSFYKEVKHTKSKYLPINELMKFAKSSSIMDVAFSQTFPRDIFAPMNGLTLKETSHKFQIDLINMLLIEQQESNKVLRYRVRYDESVVDLTSLLIFIEWYKDLFTNILNDLLDDKEDTKIDTYNLLTQSKKDYLLYELNSIESDYPSTSTLQGLFEKQVIKTPETIALYFQGRTLTYQELNERSNQLAHYLLTMYQIQPDEPITLCQTRTEYMLISMLAILKSGGAYVPIDPEAPSLRKEYILQDTRSRVLLINSAVKLEISGDIPVKIETVDSQDFIQEVSQQPKENPKTLTHEKNLSYIIYTSGTTGTPKGVMVEHQGVCNLICAEEKELVKSYPPNYSRKNLWYIHYIFDAHVYEIYSPLLYGHSLYMLEEETRLNLDAIISYVSEHKIDQGSIPPALLRTDALLNLHTLILGGENTPKEIIEKYLAQGTRVINAYGPTEVTVCSNQHTYNPGNSVQYNTNIGRPIQNLKNYILDKNLQPVPEGVIGELYIGGVGVTRGYLNHPELTETMFIPNPYQSEDEKKQGLNARIYRSGDLARYLPNGEVEYLGRKDNQVKIRGYRIELGEIEQNMLDCPGVDQSVVLCKENTKGNKFLLGYYVSEKQIEKELVSKYLEEHLPDYMVPSVLIPMDEFSITVNGKIDRKKLPEPEFEQNNIYIAPKNDIEAQLCEIYGNVLGIDPSELSVEENFFRLGGDSIVSIQLVSRIRQKLNVDLGVKDIFKYTTIRSLCNEVISKGIIQKKIISEQGILEGKVDLLPIQEWFFDLVKSEIISDYNHWNQAFVLSVPLLDVEILKKSIALLVEYHDNLRLRYKKNGHDYLQFYSKQVDINFDCINNASTLDLEKLYTEWQNKFDIFNGPLFHFGYLEGFSEGKARIHVALHHLIVDAVSWRILANDLQLLYKYLLENRFLDNITSDKILGAKRSSYRQWVEVVKSFKINEKQNLTKENEYWNRFNCISDVNKILLTQVVAEENLFEIVLGEQETKSLVRDIHQVYNTQINDILLAVLASTLKKITNSNTNYIVLEGHGREVIANDLDISNTVGWFTSMYPVELHSDYQNIGEIISSTKDMLHLIPENGIGYGAIHGYIKKELPLIAFNYLGLFEVYETEDSWSFINENFGKTSTDNNKSKNVLDINCGIINGKFKLLVSGKLRKEEITRFSNDFVTALQQFISYLLNEKQRKFLTLSDIDYIVSKDTLDTFQQQKDVEAVILANSLQQGFIYHSLNQGKSDDSYKIQTIWNYHCTLDIDKLQKSWSLAQEKYSALRMRFSWKDKMVQIIDAECNLNWEFIDISDLNEQRQEEFIEDLIKNDRQKNYDLDKGDLFRVYIACKNSQNYTCIFSNHHAILDGWSSSILMKYIHDTYQQLLENQKVNLEKEITYIKAQKYLQKTEGENLYFWHEYKNRIEEKENLNALLIPEKKQINLSEYKQIQQLENKVFKVFGEQYEAVKNQCSLLGVTVNVFLQYCWHKLLSTYSGSETTILGMVVSGRNLPIEDIEQSVGLYINTLPVILQHKDEKFVEVLKRLQEDINEINSRSNSDLVKLQKSNQRLFNSVFAFENYPFSAEELKEKFSIEIVGAKEKLDYPLAVAAYDQENTLLFKLSYAAELINEKTIDMLFSGMEKLVEQFISDPFIKLSKIDLLTESKKDYLLYELNSTESDYPSASTLQGLFEKQVIKTPETIALYFQGRTLTYQELNERSNQLAHYLLTKYQIQPDEPITLCQTRTEYMLISMLAILKSGGAYVPIDPEAPSLRKEYILQDTCSCVLLINSAVKLEISGDIPVKIETVDSHDFIQEVSQQPKENPKTLTHEKNLSYIIYTSGTTGTPKGVMVEHQGVCNLICAEEKELVKSYPPNYSRKNLWYIHYIFDAHVYEIYSPLLYGHSLYMLEEETRLNLDAIISYVSEHKIDQASLPPALLRTDALVGLHTVILGGENTPKEIIEKYLAQGTRVINAYGPTEVTVVCNQHIYNPGDKVQVNTNIGRPIQNLKNYILDKNLQPVPEGVIGELYIGGVGVTRGYLNHPELTETMFIPNPYQSEDEKKQGLNARIYRSGDLARYLPKGEVEYLGRKDNQVKIRGYRIELGEIEQSILDCPGVDQSVVLCKENTKGIKFLLGYYVSEKQIEKEILYKYLEEHLPAYMVPSVLIPMDEFPMTVNGKIDRKKLPEPEFEQNNTYVAPENDIEAQLCEIYGNVLGIPVDEISVKDNFFRLGGNSILAVKLMVEINKILNSNIELSDIFKNKTIRELSKTFGYNEKKTLLKINKSQKIEPEDQLLSFAQERLWFLTSYEVDNAYNIPIAIKISKDTDIQILKKSLQKVVQRHEILRSLIKTNSKGEGYQEVREEDIQIDYEESDNIKALEDSMKEIADKKFILDKEYPIYAKIYKCEHSLYMIIVVHHIAFDGWSADIFINELYNIYKILLQHKKQNKESEEIKISPVTLQYKDFALWQRKYLSREILEGQLDYWKNQLEGFETLSLPGDKTRPLYPEHKGKDIEFSLDVKTSNQLRDLAKELNVSLYSVMLSGYYLLLSSFSNQQDIVIGTPVAGRNYKEIQDIIGLFINTLVLRKKIDSRLNLAEFIEQTGESVMQAQLYQDLPFEQLVDALNVEKDTSRHPLFQVMFGLQSFGDIDRTDTSEIFTNYQPIYERYSVAKFDITTMLDDSKESIKGSFNYAISIFNEETITNYIKTYIHILKQFSKINLEKKISEITYLTEEDYNKIIGEWNQTWEYYPKDKTIVDMFKEQVERTPDNIAVIFENNSLTYRELHERTNSLGNYLKEKYSILPDELIALYIDRSENMLVSIYSILKSGAAYVPIDPNIPVGRIQFMIKDTNVRVIITEEKYKRELQDKLQGLSVDIISIDDKEFIGDIYNTYSKEDVEVLISPQNLAYVIYTSGTTGNPKGVMIEHTSLVGEIFWVQKNFPIMHTDRILQKTTYIFDISVLELFWANWYGATIVFAHPEKYKDSIYLSQLIKSEKITMMSFVPSMITAFLEVIEENEELRENVQNVRYIFCGGEDLNIKEALKVRELIPDCKLFNVYGPTEATIDVLRYDCTQSEKLEKIYIGKPNDNTSVYILNKDKQPVPIGGVGDLYVGGIGLSRGYINNTELTSKKFIKNKFQTKLERNEGYNERIYDTGDLARYSFDGNVEFLGRNDFQVNIRGFRIELGEIEFRLKEFPGVKQAVVQVKSMLSGANYLVGYYVSDEKQESDRITSFMKKYLPDYMIPITYIHLNGLPVTLNGKLDRKALPEPELLATEKYIAPENEVEKELCKIFAEILDLDVTKVGGDNDFYKLGGNSILAIKLVFRINNKFNSNIKLADVLNYETIRIIAHKIKNAKEYQPVMELNTSKETDNIFMVHPGLGGCEVYTSIAEKFIPYYKCYGIDSYNFYNSNKIMDLIKLSAYYLEQIVQIQNKGDYYLFGWSFGGYLSLEIAAQLESRGMKNIVVYLLDTWVNIEVNKAEEKENIILEIMKKFNMSESAKNKLEEMLAIDGEIALQPLSSKLKYTQVVLFRAVNDENSKKYGSKYPMNKVELYLESLLQIQVIDIEATHNDILDHEEEIVMNVCDYVFK